MNIVNLIQYHKTTFQSFVSVLELKKSQSIFFPSPFFKVHRFLIVHGNVTFKHLIPQHWTQLPNSIYISHLGAFPNLSAILDPIWAEDLPELNLISPEITEFDWDIFPKIMAYASNIHYFTLILIGYILFRNPQLLTGSNSDRPIQFVRMPPKARKRNVRVGATRPSEIESGAPSHSEAQTQI